MDGLIDEVMLHLKVEERDYFGLYYAFKEQRVGVLVRGWCVAGVWLVRGWRCCTCEVVKCCRAGLVAT